MQGLNGQFTPKVKLPSLLSHRLVRFKTHAQGEGPSTRAVESRRSSSLFATEAFIDKEIEARYKTESGRNWGE